MAQRLDFIDISHHNGSVDFGTAAAHVLGVIMKATEGSTYVDDKYKANRAAAEAVGLPVCTYHFLKHGNIADQMEHYLNTVRPEDGERIVIDYEDAACTIVDLIQAVSWWQTYGGVEITVYGANKLTVDVNNGIANDVSNIFTLASTSLWIARYSTTEPEIASDMWMGYSAWQYSQSGSVPGLSGDVDLNMFNGSQENCLKWFGPSSGAVPQPPEPEESVVEVNIDITVPPGVTVKVVLNGDEYSY